MRLNCVFGALCTQVIPEVIVFSAIILCSIHETVSKYRCP